MPVPTVPVAPRPACSRQETAWPPGAERVTVQNLDVVTVDAENDLIAIKGAIPGPKGGIVFVKSTVKTHVEKKGPAAGISNNPQKASARANPQKASARNR